MKKILYILIVCLCSGSLSSCKDDDDEIDYAWKNANEEAFHALKDSPGFRSAEVDKGPGNVYYKVLDESAVTSETVPFFTSVVTVAYKGRLYNSNIYFDQNEQFTFKLDGSNYYMFGQAIAGTSVISGWQVALQNMREGEKWEVWIPWALAYGAAGSGAIPGYSTLVFEIELKKIEQLYPLTQEES